MFGTGHGAARRSPRRQATRILTAAAARVPTILVAPAMGSGAAGAASSEVVSLRQAATDPGTELTAEIRRTEYGIPHIKADDWAGLGYGYGYAFAEDNACLLAEMVGTARAEPLGFFGDRADHIADAHSNNHRIQHGGPTDTPATPDTTTPPRT